MRTLGAKGPPFAVFLLLFVSSTEAKKKAINAVITRKERIASRSPFSDPISSSTSALHVSRRKEAPLSSTPAFFPNGRKGANLSPQISSRTASCLEALRGGSDAGGGDYYGSAPDYDDRDASRGRGYNYEYYDDRVRDDDYYGGDYGDYGERGSRGYYDDEDGRYHGDYSYDDRGRRSSSRKSSFSGMPSIVKTGNKKIGTLLLGGGAALTTLGVMLFFNKTLMRLGNILLVFGVPMWLGPGRTAGYFLQPKKARATGCLLAGVFLVFVGWPIFGILLEIFGLLNLIGNMFPVAKAILKQLPIVGSLLGNSGNGGGNRKKQQHPSRDYYNDDDRNYRYGDDRYPDGEQDDGEPYY